MNFPTLGSFALVMPFQPEAKNVLVLDVPDEYEYMDPELVEILERHWEDIVG